MPRYSVNSRPQRTHLSPSAAIRGVGHLQRLGAERAEQLGLAYLAVSPDERAHDFIAVLVQDRLYEATRLSFQKRANLLDRLHGGSADLFDRPGLAVAGGVFYHRFSRLLGRGVAAFVARATYNPRLSRIGEHHELVRDVASDSAGIGQHWSEPQSAPPKYGVIRAMHFPVVPVETFLVAIEAVGVFHYELAAAHNTEARADLVAKLALYLVQRHGKLPVRAQAAAHGVGNDFLVRRPEHEVALVAVLESHELVAVNVPATGLFPQLGRAERGHEQLERPNAVHLLAHDLFDFSGDDKPERQQRINAGADLLEHAGAQHQLVADDFRLRRVFFGCGNVCPAPAHQSSSSIRDISSSIIFDSSTFLHTILPCLKITLWPCPPATP